MNVPRANLSSAAYKAEVSSEKNGQLKCLLSQIDKLDGFIEKWANTTDLKSLKAQADALSANGVKLSYNFAGLTAGTAAYDDFVRKLGVVERFMGFLRYSVYVPLMSKLRAAGLSLDTQTANQEVRRWLNNVANAREHGTTKAVPQLRWSAERPHLLPLPPSYPGRPILNAPERLTDWRTVPPIQHSLTVYDDLLVNS